MTAATAAAATTVCRALGSERGKYVNKWPLTAIQ